MEYQGILLKKIDETSGVSTRGTAWKMANYLLQENTTFQPKHIVISVFDADVARIATWDAMIGKVVTANFSISARQGKNGSWYNSINGYGIRSSKEEKKEEAAAQPQQPQPAAQEKEATVQQTKSAQPIDWENNGDGLPF